MEKYHDILFDVRDGVAKITINRPEKYNAFTAETCEELIDAFRRAGYDKSVAVIVLGSAGDKAFCTGADQSAHEGAYEGRGTIGLPIDELQSLIRDVPKPVIARVQGFAIGGGNVLATLCDLTIASEKAVFGQVGPKVGSVDPGFGTAYLARLVGEKRAREIWYLCRRYTAKEAYDMGLVNAVVPADKLDEEVDKWCAEIQEQARPPSPSPSARSTPTARICAPSARSASRRWRCSTAPRNPRRAAAPSARSGRRGSATRRSKSRNSPTMNIQLSIGITSNPRTWPIIDGAVAVEGVDLHADRAASVRAVLAAVAVRRVRRFRNVDVVADDGEVEGRRALRRHSGVHHADVLPHHASWCGRTPRSTRPADLKGKRVGVPEYQQTAALWIRGALQHEFGVEPKDMEFWMERPPSRSHGGATGFKPPPGVTVNQVPPDKSIGSMMVSGELAGRDVLSARPNLIDRSTIDLAQPPRHQAAVSRSCRRGRALLPQDRPLSDQPWHGDQARSLPSGIPGR